MRPEEFLKPAANAPEKTELFGPTRPTEITLGGSPLANEFGYLDSVVRLDLEKRDGAYVLFYRVDVRVDKTDGERNPPSSNPVTQTGWKEIEICRFAPGQLYGPAEHALGTFDRFHVHQKIPSAGAMDFNTSQWHKILAPIGKDEECTYIPFHLQYAWGPQSNRMWVTTAQLAVKYVP